MYKIVSLMISAFAALSSMVLAEPVIEESPPSDKLVPSSFQSEFLIGGNLHMGDGVSLSSETVHRNCFGEPLQSSSEFRIQVHSKKLNDKSYLEYIRSTTPNSTLINLLKNHVIESDEQGKILDPRWTYVLIGLELSEIKTGRNIHNQNLNILAQNLIDSEKYAEFSLQCGSRFVGVLNLKTRFYTLVKFNTHSQGATDFADKTLYYTSGAGAHETLSDSYIAEMHQRNLHFHIASSGLKDPAVSSELLVEQLQEIRRAYKKILAKDSSILLGEVESIDTTLWRYHREFSFLSFAQGSHLSNNSEFAIRNESEVHADTEVYFSALSFRSRLKQNINLHLPNQITLLPTVGGGLWKPKAANTVLNDLLSSSRLENWYQLIKKSDNDFKSCISLAAGSSFLDNYLDSSFNSLCYNYHSPDHTINIENLLKVYNPDTYELDSIDPVLTNPSEYQLQCLPIHNSNEFLDSISILCRLTNSENIVADIGAYQTDWSFNSDILMPEEVLSHPMKDWHVIFTLPEDDNYRAIYAMEEAEYELTLQDAGKVHSWRVSYGQGKVFWDTNNSGDLPANTWLAGSQMDGDPLYLCRGYFKDHKVPGGLEDWGGISVCFSRWQWRSIQSRNSDGDIVFDDDMLREERGPQEPSLLAWESQEGDQIPPHALIAGESNNRLLFACRVNLLEEGSDETPIGYLEAGDEVCRYTSDGSVYEASVFEVLIWNIEL